MDISAIPAIRNNDTDGGNRAAAESRNNSFRTFMTSAIPFAAGAFQFTDEIMAKARVTAPKDATPRTERATDEPDTHADRADRADRIKDNDAQARSDSAHRHEDRHEDRQEDHRNDRRDNPSDQDRADNSVKQDAAARDGARDEHASKAGASPDTDTTAPNAAAVVLPEAAALAMPKDLAGGSKSTASPGIKPITKPVSAASDNKETPKAGAPELPGTGIKVADNNAANALPNAAAAAATAANHPVAGDASLPGQAIAGQATANSGGKGENIGRAANPAEVSPALVKPTEAAAQSRSPEQTQAGATDRPVGPSLREIMSAKTDTPITPKPVAEKPISDSSPAPVLTTSSNPTGAARIELPSQAQSGATSQAQASEQASQTDQSGKSDQAAKSAQGRAAIARDLPAHEITVTRELPHVSNPLSARGSAPQFLAQQHALESEGGARFGQTQTSNANGGSTSNALGSNTNGQSAVATVGANAGGQSGGQAGGQTGGQAGNQASSGQLTANTNASSNSALLGGGKETVPNFAQALGLRPGMQPAQTARPLPAQMGNEASGARPVFDGTTANLGGPQSTADPATRAEGTTASRSPAHPNTAAEQVSIRLAKAASNGDSTIRIQLRPGDLGRVEVKLELGKDGQVRAVVAAERPETLEMLQRDSRALERALQDAGFKTDSNSLEYTLKDGQGSGTGERTAEGQGSDDGRQANNSEQETDDDLASTANDPGAESANTDDGTGEDAVVNMVA